MDPDEGFLTIFLRSSRSACDIWYLFCEKVHPYPVESIPTVIVYNSPQYTRILGYSPISGCFSHSFNLVSVHWCPKKTGHVDFGKSDKEAELNG
jgi:hypothetical protein